MEVLRTTILYISKAFSAIQTQEMGYANKLQADEWCQEDGIYIIHGNVSIKKGIPLSP